jgi:hypothetical protein
LGNFAKASVAARSCIAITNGVAQCAECSASSESLPALSRSMIGRASASLMSPLRTWPHQISTSQLSSTSSDNPFSGSLIDTVRTRMPS